MPSIASPESSRVLVTGANGYLAMWIIRALLRQGYSVRGTVRTADKVKRLQDHFNTYGRRVEWIIVEDITKGGAYDEVVKDVDAIEHLASPSKAATDDPDEYIKPAVDGTLSILQSALRFGNNLRRIVLTSSVSAILRPIADSDPFVTFDENDWSDAYVEAVKREGIQSSFVMKYFASKNLAEKVQLVPFRVHRIYATNVFCRTGAWEFYHRHKDSIKWDLVSLNPSLVIGAAPVEDVQDFSALPVSLSLWYSNVFEDQPEDRRKATWEYIDIHDVTDAHIKALEKEEAAGERIILSAGTSTWQDTRNLVFSLRPDLSDSGHLSLGTPNLPRRVAYQYNTEKGQRILGVQYKRFEDTILRMVAYLESHEWIKK